MGADLRTRIERVLGARVLEVRPVSGGYTPAKRWVVQLDDGRTAFAKAATNADTTTWLRQESANYGQLQASFLPDVLGWCEDGEHPVLLLEDLSNAHWPPPWTPDHVRQVRDVLTSLHALPAPAELPSMRAYAEEFCGWRRVAAEPGPFLALGLTSPAWLAAALPSLRAAEASVSLEGEAVCHLDVRSDNLCFAPRGAILVDWNFACRGNADLDTAFWLPSLAVEGGAAPEASLPDSPGCAALVAGYFAANAGHPPIPGAPGVRPLQLRQLRHALPWAVRALGLPPLDGSGASCG